MRKILLASFVMLLLTAASALAQTERGKILTGGSLSLRIPTNDSDDIKQSYFNFNPSLGFFLADNVALGASIPISSSRYTDDGARRTSRSSSFGIAPFGRYYVGPDNFKFFVEGRFGLEHYKTRTEQGTIESESSDDAIFVGLGAGVAFFLNEHVSIEPKLSYDAYSRNNTNSAFNLNVGFQIYLP